MSRWWFWMGYPHDEYRAFGPVEEDYKGAFDVQSSLERDYPAFWHRWRWNGRKWIYEGNEKVSLLWRQAPEGTLAAQW